MASVRGGHWEDLLQREEGNVNTISLNAINIRAHAQSVSDLVWVGVVWVLGSVGWPCRLTGKDGEQ